MNDMSKNSLDTGSENIKNSLRLSHHFLEISKECDNKKQVLKEFLSEIREFTGCEAIGIRLLDKQGNIPYEEYVGFGQHEMNSPVPVKSGNCMCVNVINGDTDPRLPFFTDGHSYYMNGRTHLLPSVLEDETCSACDVCNKIGYESVALVPIQTADKILGCIHLADRKENMFSLEKVTVLEKEAIQLASALQRVTAAEALKNSEKHYMELFNSINDAIIIHDLSGKIINVNKSTYKILDCISSGSSLITLEDIISPKYVHALTQQLSGVQQHGYRTFETYFLKQDGTVLPVEITSRLIEYSGQTVFLSIARDIAEGKQAKDELRQLNEEFEERIKKRTLDLEAANKELEAFSYSVSHDLRGPLRRIDGFSKALLEDYTDKLDEQGKDYLNRVFDSTKKMSELIDAMLNLSRLTRREINFETVDLSIIVKDIAAELRNTQPERKVDFVIAENAVAKCDAVMLRVVLGNLLGNAWKFTGEKPGARIEFGVTGIDGDNVYFVRDNGAGFDPAHDDKLFGAFQRLHAESEFPGIGIGLATVQRVIHRHGGRIWAESELEKGATFSFTLNNCI